AALFEQLLPYTTRGMLVIDDLQWADDDSLELLALLVEKVPRTLTIVASWTTAGELPPRARALLDRLGAAATVVELAAMTHDALAEVIADLAPYVNAERVRAAADLATGSPYLAELIGLELASEALEGDDEPLVTRSGRIPLATVAPEVRRLARL